MRSSCTSGLRSLAPALCRAKRNKAPRLASSDECTSKKPSFAPGQNILRAAASMRRGETVLSPGHEIRPTEVGLLAEVGRTEIDVIARLSVAVLSTGNELVRPQQAPIGGQIRNSNGPMIAAAIRAAGATPVELGISRDDPAELREKLSQGLQSDVLVISGGVSAGALDLVPSLLKELGVEEVFHHVRLKPGKPIWFGLRRESPTPSPQARSAELTVEAPIPCLVFGLPGNPVSSLVCFELFVRPALARLAGKEIAEKLATIRARLGGRFRSPRRPSDIFPSILSPSDDGSTITPLAWSGSAICHAGLGQRVGAFWSRRSSIPQRRNDRSPAAVGQVSSRQSPGKSFDSGVRLESTSIESVAYFLSSHFTRPVSMSYTAPVISISCFSSIRRNGGLFSAT